MPDLPISFDARIRYLEATLSKAMAELAALRRTPEVVQPWPIRWAETCRTLQQVGTGQQNIYPAPPACRLPIRFDDIACDGTDHDWTPRAPTQQNWAYCTHWVPEGWKIAVFEYSHEYHAFPIQYLIRVRPNSPCSPGAAVACTVYAAGVPTSQVIPNVYLDWAHSNQLISAGKDAMCAWFHSEKRFAFVGAECE